MRDNYPDKFGKNIAERNIVYLKAKSDPELERKAASIGNLHSNILVPYDAVEELLRKKRIVATDRGVYSFIRDRFPFFRGFED